MFFMEVFWAAKKFTFLVGTSKFKATCVSIWEGILFNLLMKSVFFFFFLLLIDTSSCRFKLMYCALGAK